MRASARRVDSQVLQMPQSGRQAEKSVPYPDRCHETAAAYFHDRLIFVPSTHECAARFTCHGPTLTPFVAASSYLDSVYAMHSISRAFAPCPK